VYASIISKADIVLRTARQRIANIINQCPANYAYNWVDGEFKRHTDESDYADLPSQGIFGVRKPSSPYEFYWCRHLSSVNRMQEIIVYRLSDPLWEVEIDDITMRRVHVDTGDYVICSIPELYDSDGSQLINQYWKVLATRLDSGKSSISFRLLQTEDYLSSAYLADGTYLADSSIRAGGDRDITVY